MTDKRKVYSREIKEQVVELLNTSGEPGNRIEAELGIGNGLIYRWRRQLQEEGQLAFPGNGNERDRELAELRWENAAKYRCGSPRVTEELHRRGYTVGHNRVAWLMKANGLNARPRKKLRVTTILWHKHEAAPNVVDRELRPSGPILIWESDATYLSATITFA